MPHQKVGQNIESSGESTPLLHVDTDRDLGNMQHEEDMTSHITHGEGNATGDVEYDIYTASGGHVVVKSEELPANIVGARTTNIECLMHLLKGNTGVGILAMPVAYKNGGLWLSLALVSAVGIICTHCMNVLVKCGNELCRRTKTSHLGYANVMEKAFETRNDWLRNWGNFARTTVNAFLVTTQLGICCTYIVFIAENLKQVVEYTDLVAIDTKLYIVMVTALLIPYSMVKSLKMLAPFSALANMINCVGLLVIFVNLWQDLPDTKTRQSVAEPDNLPLFLGQILFAFEGIGLVLPLHKKMKDKDAFLGKAGLLSLGLTIVIALDNAVGFYGYLKYGDDAKGSITLNLPNDQWLYLTVKLMFAVSVFLTYAIQFYVPVDIIWTYMKVKKTKNGSSLPAYTEYALRFTLVLVTCGLSTLIPHLDLLIALIGASESSFLALILPTFLELITFECSRIVRVKNVLILVLGLVGCVIGTYTSIVEIARTF